MFGIFYAVICSGEWCHWSKKRGRVNQNDLNKVANPKKFSNPKSETQVSLKKQKAGAVAVTALKAPAHSCAGEVPSDSFNERLGKSHQGGFLPAHSGGGNCDQAQSGRSAARPSLAHAHRENTLLVTRSPTADASVGERVTSKTRGGAKRNQNGNLNAGEKTKTALPGSPPPAPYEVRWWGAREGGRQKTNT